MGKTVWVLGAGFSAPLGGPQLRDLFSPGSRLKVETCFPKRPKLRGDDALISRLLFGEVSSKQWRDAEEFLDYLDTARLDSPDSPSREALVAMLQEARSAHLIKTGQRLQMDTREKCEAKINPIAEVSRRLLAAECSAFLVGADVESEKWAPYRRWAELVAPGDVVITFNYDLVIERLARLSGEDKFKIPTSIPNGQLFLDQVTVLKLHGSVNWKKRLLGSDPKPSWEISTRSKDDYFALDCSDEEMVIANPGPSKIALTKDGPLASLWAAAKLALKDATTIVFIGYRFPPTDSAARRELLEAIGENDKPYLEVHTVLGSNTTDADTSRLRGLLSNALSRKNRAPAHPGIDPHNDPRHYLALVHPLYGQDFLDVYLPGRLGQEYKYASPA